MIPYCCLYRTNMVSFCSYGTTLPHFFLDPQTHNVILYGCCCQMSSQTGNLFLCRVVFKAGGPDQCTIFAVFSACLALSSFLSYASQLRVALRQNVRVFLPQSRQPVQKMSTFGKWPVLRTRASCFEGRSRYQLPLNHASKNKTENSLSVIKVKNRIRKTNQKKKGKK